jgi:site-specific DNA-methyltransferase (adenine-specific)
MNTAVLPRNVVLVGDALERLRQLPDASVDVVITSPPYFQLRSYGVTDQYGMEATIEDWVDQLRTVCREIWRVLVPTGSMWLNLGDSYSRHDRFGAPPKSLLLGPQRLALGLVADGWRLRNQVVWAKTNPMPSSVGDRLSCTWEHLYFFTKQNHYFFDLDAIRVPHLTNRNGNRRVRHRKPAATYLPPEWVAPLSHDHHGLASMKNTGRVGHTHGKNPGDVWQLATAAYRGAHFATFPIRLIERPLAATCPQRRCRRCRIPIVAAVGRTAINGATVCGCDAGSEPGVVLDPFMGAGTVGVAAKQAQRSWLGIEINPDFARQATQRIRQASGRDPPPSQSQSQRATSSNESSKGGEHA